MMDLKFKRGTLSAKRRTTKEGAERVRRSFRLAPTAARSIEIPFADRTVILAPDDTLTLTGDPFDWGFLAMEGLMARGLVVELDG